MSEHKIPIPSRVYNAAVGGHVTGADQIIDDKTGLTLDKVAGGALEEKTYTSDSYNGMGRVVLRKNLVEGVNTLTQSMINKSNTIYIIQYDFTLGENITIPENCILKFDGGCISANGTGKDTIVGNNICINAGLTKIFNDVNLVNSGIKKFNAEWFGNIKTNFPQVYINKIEPNISEKSTLIINTDITVNQTTYIKKSINFEFKDIITTSSTADIFVLGDSTHTINNISFKAHYIYQIYDSDITSYLTLTNSFIKVQSCVYSDFYFEKCNTIGYPIYFYPVGGCGQNRFSFNECIQGNCGITFSNGNATNWSEAYWCEGNQFLFGFIVRYNKGVDLHDCVRCKANLYSGAIDNVETNGYDIYDNSNKIDYYTKSIWLMNFYRLEASIIDKFDTILDPSSGLFMAGGIYADGIISSNHEVIAGTYFKVQANSNARLDLNDNSGDYQDYKSRIMLMNNGNLSLIGNKGRTHIFAYDYSIAPLSGTTTISANTTQITINFTGGIKDNNYSINVSPHWNTTWWIVIKNTVGIVIEFGNAPYSDSEFDWTIYGKN